MTKPVKSLTLEFYRAGDVMPEVGSRHLIIDRLGKGNIILSHMELANRPASHGDDKLYWLDAELRRYVIDHDDLWAYWPEKELEDE